MDQKTNQQNITPKNITEKLFVELCLCISPWFFLTEKLCSIRQIPISQSILFLLGDVCKGEIRRFMTEKPRSTPEIEDGVSNANLKRLCK